MNVYERVISAIATLISDRELSTVQTLDAMENIRDHIEPWIDALQDDLKNEAAEGGER